MVSKAQDIRDLYAAGMDVARIAAHIGVSKEYVRVCARQRRKGQLSVADSNWRRGVDMDAANAAAREVYAEARKRGASVDDARGRAARARSDFINRNRQSS